MIYGYMLNDSGSGVHCLNENSICREQGFLITIDFDQTVNNFIYDPYVKIYPTSSYDTATEVARIHFLTSLRYEKAHIGKKVINFKNKDLKIICDLIKKHWDKLIKCFIDGCNITGYYKVTLLNTPYPEQLYDSIKN